MRALLHDLLLSLESDDPLVLAGLQTLFDLEVKAASTIPEEAAPDIRLSAAAVSQTPPLPDHPPSYIDPVPEYGRRVRFHETPSGGILDLARPAQIHFDFDANQAAIYVTQTIVDTGNLEDVTMIALAPFLRRRGFYMAHAFAVAGDSAVLLSGPSGSGKTTTGLALVEDGAGFLANDVTLLQSDEGIITAYLSPGAVNLHPTMLSLLPAYEGRIGSEETVEGSGKFVLSREALFADTQLGRPSPVSTILFPTITAQDNYSLHKLPAAVGMARLVEEGVDQWDRATYEDHLNLLAALASQAHFFELRLPAGDPARLRSLAHQLARQFL